MPFDIRQAKKAEAAARDCLEECEDAYPSERQMFIAYSKKHKVSISTIRRYYKALRSNQSLPGGRYYFRRAV